MLSCPVPEIVYGGARGGGKTYAALLHWIDHQDRYGRHAQGVLFRRRYKRLDEVVRLGRELFVPLGARWISGGDQYQFRFGNGAVLKLRHMLAERDADEYQGHGYSWICFEEMQEWPSPAPINRMRATLRSGEGVPTWLIGTCNPGGVGHLWVKERYIDPVAPMTPITDEYGLTRVFIPAKLADNRALLLSDPDYVSRLKLSGPEWLVRAWLEGDWEIVAGGYFEGIWNPRAHVIEPFDMPLSWSRWRALDWGYAAPYSVGWYAMDHDGTVYRYRELYGWGGAANVGTRETAEEVADKITQIEADERKAGIAFRRNPADSSIWNKIGTELSIGEHFMRAGITWTPALKGPNSRTNNLHEVVQRLHQSSFLVFDSCRHWLRTVPIIPADEHNPDDVDTEAEDHCLDETRYSLASRQRRPQRPRKDTALKPFTWDWLTSQDRPPKSKYRL